VDHTEHDGAAVKETPSQANFIGTLAIVLFGFAVLVALAGLIAGLTHTAII